MKKVPVVIFFIPLFVGSRIHDKKKFRIRIRDGKKFGSGIKHSGSATLYLTKYYRYLLLAFIKYFYILPVSTGTGTTVLYCAGILL
jgi:hypothetical protein